MNIFFPKRMRRVPVVFAPLGGVGGRVGHWCQQGGGGRRMTAGRSVFQKILRVGLPAVFSNESGPDFDPCGIICWPLRVDLRSFLQIIYDIGTGFLIFHCFATKMLLLFCKSMIPVRFCTVFHLHSFAGIKTRFKALLKTQYLTLGPNF